jgi:hypothetical protein
MKVDRFNRSLLDFSRIMDVLDRHGATFVAVTQEFNATSSLGRLTLNILLSFAQLEREMISERTGDKMSAAQKKGKWMGGTLVLGYGFAPDASGLVVTQQEAFQVRSEHPEHTVGEPTILRYVQGRKRELGLSGREVYVPQSYSLGQEGQVDWFEGTAKLGGEACKLQFFAMRSMGSGDAFHRAYTHATQQALLEAHEHAFDYFGGVFQKLRFDNMASLVKKILRGHQRIETDRIIAFRSHWGFQSEYCNPASGNEKGGVEGELGSWDGSGARRLAKPVNRNARSCRRWPKKDSRSMKRCTR